MESWRSGSPYERYVGRWSRRVAAEFMTWLALPPAQVWGDVGCGTGALVEALLAAAEPAAVLALDRSPGFLFEARRMVPDPRVHYVVADAAALPCPPGACDITVSGLVLNFVPDPLAMLHEMARVTRSGGTVAVYVWDYASGMQMMRRFWDAAIQVSPDAVRLDEAERFPLCQPEALTALFQEAGLKSPVVSAILIPTIFQDFDDFWSPFLGKQGPAPTYLAALDQEKQTRIRELLRDQLAPPGGGPITLSARAWAVRGSVENSDRTAFR